MVKFVSGFIIGALLALGLGALLLSRQAGLFDDPTPADYGDDRREAGQWQPRGLHLEAVFSNSDMHARPQDGLALYRQQKILDLGREVARSVCFSRARGRSPASGAKLALAVTLFEEDRQALQAALKVSADPGTAPSLRLLSGNTEFVALWLEGWSAEAYADARSRGALTADFAFVADEHQIDDLMAIAAVMQRHRPVEACSDAVDLSQIDHFSDLTKKHWGEAAADWEAARKRLKN
jgi:hypothetical protein